MTIRDYQTIIEKTAVYPREIGLMYCTMGLSGEAGEVSNKVKKIYRDKDGVLSKEDAWNIAKEASDCLWYITALANELGFTMEEIMQYNYDKLIKRRETGTLQGSGDDREEIIPITFEEGELINYTDRKGGFGSTGK